MSKRSPLVRGARRRPTPGRRLALEGLETREAPGSVLAVEPGASLFAPFARDPFAASETCSVCQNWTGALDREWARSSSRGTSLFGDRDGVSQASEKDSRRPVSTDPSQASGTG